MCHGAEEPSDRSRVTVSQAAWTQRQRVRDAAVQCTRTIAWVTVAAVAVVVAAGASPIAASFARADVPTETRGDVQADTRPASVASPCDTIVANANTTLCLPIAVHRAGSVAADAAHVTWWNEQVAEANRLLGPLGVTVAAREPAALEGVDQSVTRADRDAIVRRVATSQMLDVYIVASLRDVDDPTKRSTVCIGALMAVAS